MATTTGNPRGREEHMGKDAAEKAKNVGAQTMDKAKEMGGQAVDKAKEVAGGAMDKAKEAVSSVGTMASQAATSVGKRVEEMAGSAGADMRKWGDSLAGSGPHEGTMGHMTQAVGETLREGGRYIEEAKLSGMADDVSSMIRRNPVPAVLIGIGIGFILGRAMRS